MAATKITEAKKGVMFSRINCVGWALNDVLALDDELNHAYFTRAERETILRAKTFFYNLMLGYKSETR